MKKIMNFFLLSCNKATLLIEKKVGDKLSSAEKVQLAVHTSMCSACKAYTKESEDLDHTLRNHFTTANKAKPLPDSFKSQIISSLKK